MSSHVKSRKVAVVDYDTQIKEVRCQLVDQLKVFDLQLEQKSQLLQDVTDYLRRRGEIEGEYARSLDKLAERFTSKIKRKDQSGMSVPQCWLVLLAQTRQESKDHSALNECCSTTLSQPLSHCYELTQRLARKSKDVCTQLQDELLKVTAELQLALKTYHQYHSEYVCAEGKLREVAKMEEKPKQSTSKKVEKLIEKRQGKFQEILLKCTKARNDYLLNLAAANSSMNKYYLQDISTIIDCSDLGYHLTTSGVIKGYMACQSRAQQNLSTGLQQLQNVVAALDQNRDRDILLQAHNATFCLPLRFQYQPHEGDQVCEVSAECEMRAELQTRFHQLQSRLGAVTLETEEARKTMQAAYSALQDIMGEEDFGPSYEHSSLSQEGNNDASASKPSLVKRRANQQETENLYITKLKEHLCGSSIVSKLQAKHDLLKAAVDKAEPSNGNGVRKSVPVRRIQPRPHTSQKLFTGDLLSFIQASGQKIPFVVESCIRFINLNGLHHEGVFRVPGSQVEVNHIRDAFEQGEDPLADRHCDIDTVAGVLKLYFRGLEKPLFPEESVSQLMECIQVDGEAERAARLKLVILLYPPPVVTVMRYLFAFLHHVSQYSDENMMQPFNLAVCFGPSLVRGSNADDVVLLQPQINALIKTIILQHENIFPTKAELPGPVYEKCMTLTQEDCELITEEDVESETPHNKEEMETVAVLDCNPCPPADPLIKKGEGLKVKTSDNNTFGAHSTLQLSRGSFSRPPNSPGFLRKPEEAQEKSSSEDIPVKVDKEVHRQMNSVFQELLSRQLPDSSVTVPSSASNVIPSSVPLQKKGASSRKGKGLFRSPDQTD